MRSSSAKSTSMLAHCGSALAMVMHTRYSPFHDFISRSMRSTRSMRRMRRKEMFGPPPAKATVIPRSKPEMITIVPSSRFQPSRQ